MEIRKARIEDLEGIVKVANTNKINYEHPQINGFLVYVLDSEDYKDRIQISNHFYVAFEGDEVKGFLMCYDNQISSELNRNGSLEHEDQLSKVISEKEVPYIFGDQIGILPEKNLNGIGSALMRALFEDMRNQRISKMYVGILHKPVLNTASKEFCERLGFRFVEEVTNNDKHVWGIYELNLGEK